MFESAPGLYLVLTADLTIVGVSDAYLRATMTQRDAIVGRHLFDVFPDNPADSLATGEANLRSSLRRVLEERRADTMAVQKYDIQRPESEGGGFEERHWSPSNWPVFDRAGKIAYIIHRVEDVTEFLRASQQTSEARRLAGELETSADAMEIEIFQRAQEIQAVNRELRDLQNELEERVRERTDELATSNEKLQREIAERQRTEDALQRSEEQLRQSQKLEAVGRLAGGIAHDFNNLLTVILSYSEMVLSDPNAGEALLAKVREIERAGQRAAELTRRLLAFSRRQVLEPTIVDVNGVLTSINALLTRVVGEDIDLKLQLAPALDKVKADRSQLEQVVMNLVVNARDAMPDGGRLTIETANVELDQEHARAHLGVEPGHYVLLAVSDTGIGMDKATQQRVFEPFFTTKEVGKGTGLGLATVFGIVKQSGGSIWLYSEPGAGATFKIYLPRAASDATPDARPAPAQKPQRGTETILLVEDEEQIRAVATQILRTAGYHVLAAGDPVDAVEISERHASRIDLLLTDVVMPKMNGRQVADRVRERRPAINVLFMSGYTDDVVLRHGALDAGVAFIQKPLTPDALTRKVREVLDSQPTAA